MALLDPHQALAFLGAAVLLTLAPGPDNLMVLSIGAARGRLRGMAFGLGCALGCLSHTALAALGVSALIKASPVAFTALKVAGGAYLVWIGWRALRSSGDTSRGATPTDPPWALFRRGLVANAINPKVIMFFLALLPQFVDASRGGTGLQIAQLGLLFTLQAAVLFGLLGYFAGAVGQWLARHANAGLWLDRVAGGVLIALGLRLIVAR
ncbi:MAG: LysE family translocator [Steroidobacteraceae bacterium]